MPKYSVVIPVYNEELVVYESYKRLSSVMVSLGDSFELIFVNDGSKDRTYALLKDICKEDRNVKIINFSKNFGHQTAISAGMDYATGEAVIIIDADLQDPPEVIPDMIEKWKDGYEVVYGKRTKRHGETAFKKMTASLYYRFLRRMTDVDIPVDTGDFRLIDRSVCDCLSSLTEKNRYIRGLVSWVGFNQTSVEYTRDKRFAGNTKYPLKKMIKFATDGIMSFSYKPLKIATYFGLFTAFLSFIYLVAVIVQKIIGHTVQGWASMVGVSLLFNGIILFMLGIIGEYIGRIYDEAKGRPLYIIKDKIGFEDEKDK